MSKYMDKLYKNASWVILISLCIGYFFYKTLKPDGSIGAVARDWTTWLHIIFVVFMQITMVDSALDSGTTNGINSSEFVLADELNNKIITSVNNEMDDFRKYTKLLNENELKSIQDDYLFSVGKTLDKLNKREKRHFKRLKPIQHNIYGFNLPLYYETSKNGKISYRSSLKKDEAKVGKKVRKALTGFLFAGMTVNVSFALENVGDAFVSLLIIIIQLIITFLMTALPQTYKFKVALPRKVILKKTFYNGYINFKNGTHKLNNIDEKPTEK